MDFSLSPEQRHWRDRVREFMNTEVRPQMATYEAERASGERWKVLPILETLKAKAKAQGLWNLFMPPQSQDAEDGFSFYRPEALGLGLSNLTYALCAEEMGRIEWASEIFNCSAPDTGNMEVLLRYGDLEQKQKWLRPLMQAEIRSAFLMTEPQVASSDATNIETRITRDGDDYVIDGTKWWSSGAGDPRCEIMIVMGKTDPQADKHKQQSMILVPKSTPGLTIKRCLPVFGYDHAPHGHAEIELKAVRVPASNLILGEGRGFEIAQGRLGPGRIHHCMRTLGAAEEALEKMTKRLLGRVAFGKPLAAHSVWEERLAKARCEIEMTRLLCLKAADMMDKLGNKAAALDIAMIKVVAPKMALSILDDAIQAFGGAGVSEEPGLASSYASIRTLRLADGPDEVHNRAIARMEFGKYSHDRKA